MHQAHRGKPTANDIFIVIDIVDVVVVVGGGGGIVGIVNMEGYYVEFGKAIEHVVAHGHGKQQNLLLDAHQFVRT